VQVPAHHEFHFQIWKCQGTTDLNRSTNEFHDPLFDLRRYEWWASCVM
jgi:hypothetical protein